MRGHSKPTIQTGKLIVNLGTRAVTVDGKPVHLTDKEYGILELLSPRIFSRPRPFSPDFPYFSAPITLGPQASRAGRPSASRKSRGRAAGSAG